MDLHAFAVRQQHHRLQQLRKSHKRDFEQIQRIKGRLSSDSPQVERGGAGGGGGARVRASERGREVEADGRRWARGRVRGE